VTLDRLKKLLPADLKPRVMELYTDFQDFSAGGSVIDFLVDLHDRQFIDSDAYRQILMSADDTITVAGDALMAGETRPQETVGLLGKGGMGEVFVARDPNLQRNVAVKRLFPNMMRRDDLVRRFYTEVQVTAQLEHPGIVPVHSLHVDEEGVPSYAMKLVKGRTVKEFIKDSALQKKEGKFDTEHELPGRLEVFLKVCDALAYAHDRGVIHRDLKPENIMVGTFNQVLLMDWGVARIIGGSDHVMQTLAPSSDSMDLTQVGETIGTPVYMSPEQAQGRNDELTGASDQFAMGLILYELVTLRRARRYKGNTMLIVASGKREPFTVGERGQDIPSDLKPIIAKATDPNPIRRYRDMGMLAEDVRRFLRDEELLVRPDSAGTRARRFLGRHRAAALNVILLLVLAVIAVGAFTMASGAAALEAQRRASAAREARLATLTGTIDEQARKLSERMFEYQTLLMGLAYTAEHALNEEPIPQKYYRETTFEDEANHPPDLKMSAVYGAPISVQWPDISLGQKVNEEDVQDQIYQLASVAPHLRRAQLQSHSLTAQGMSTTAQYNLIAERGVPLVWAYVATEEGVMISSPGSGTIDDPDYEMRDQAWYTDVYKKRGIMCDSEGVDESGMGVLLTCMQPLYSLEDEFIGVAAIDITLKWLIDHLLDPPDLGTPVVSTLVDGDMNVQVHSGQRDSARSATDFEIVRFDFADVVGESPAGFSTVDGTLVLWAPVPAMDWTYVVTGDATTLLETQ